MLSTISSSGVKIYRKVSIVLTPNIRVYCTNIFWQRIKTILTKLIDTKTILSKLINYLDAMTVEQIFFYDCYGQSKQSAW